MVALAYLPAYLFVMFGVIRLGTLIWRYNLPLIHLSTIGETLLYLKVYHDEFTGKSVKRRIRILTGCFLLFAVLDSVWIEGFHSINSYTNLAESAIIISLGILFFERVIADNVQQAQKIPLFVATVGILLYLSGTVLLYLATNHFIALNDEYNTRLMYLFNSALMFLLALIFSRAFFLARKKTPAAPVYAG